MENNSIELNFNEDAINKKMTALQKKVLKQTIDLLNGMKFEFAIIDLDGEKHGNLIVTPKKSSVRTQKFKHYVAPILDQLEIGQLIEVQKQEYKLEDLASNLAARAYYKWGPNSIATSMNRKTNVVEVLRIK